jgi:tetratricopeptide (TPR) repeat protein
VIRKAIPLALAALALLAVPPAFAKQKFPLDLTVKTADDKPVEGAAITVEAASGEPFKVEGTTDKKGRFKTQLPDFSRVYKARVTKEGMATVEQPLDIPSSGLSAGQTASWSISMHPRGPADAFNEGVRAYQQDHDLPAAAAKFEEAVQMKPDFLEGWRVLCEVYLEAKKPDKALAAADHALAVAPTDAPALRFRYYALTDLGRANDAEASLDALAASDHTPEIARLLFNSGAAAWNAKNTELARKRFGQALEADPKLYQVHSALAEIHIAEAQETQDEAVKKSRLGEAAAELDKALAIAPRNFKAWDRKIEVLKAMGDAAGAAATEKSVAELKASGG